MNKVSSLSLLAASASLLLLSSFGARADDRFSLAIGSHDLLVVFGPKGDRKAELPLPSLSQTVMVESTSFQVSYGRDANDMLTAIISPNPTQPQDLHFTVLNKSIDTDKQAVVTLTFSNNLNRVKVDPGYIGMVQVNSHRLRPDSAALLRHRQTEMARTQTPGSRSTLTDTSSEVYGAVPAGSPTAASMARSERVATPLSAHTAALPTASISLPVPAPTAAVAANAPSNNVGPAESTEGRVSDHNPEPMQVVTASQMPFTASATPGPSAVTVKGSELSPKQHSLYWAEPITPPSGIPPQVGVDEMKLVEVQGPVSVELPGGATQDGTNGMVIPSGATLSTSGGSSVAVFMGGVNSVRLLPDTEIQLTQQLSGSVRKTVVGLHQGTVFSRVGHRPGETQDYQVASNEGVAVAKGTEFADSLSNGHHYVFVVKGTVGMLVNGTSVGNLGATPNNVASGAMPPALDGNKVLFAALTALQPFQLKLQKIIGDINAGTASSAELGFFNALKSTFAVLVDDVYDPTHPNAFLGAFTSMTGFGDSMNSVLERPQDYTTINPLNQFSGALVPPSRVDETSPTGVNPQVSPH